MATVARLITSVDVNDWPDQPVGQVSFSAVMKAELVDGREIVLLDDRGWSQATLRANGSALSDPWLDVTQDELEATARTVVGPDEPVDGETEELTTRMHWAFLAGVLEASGLAVSADDLRALPHAVVLSERLLARIVAPPR
jgi:hypothetical protein